MFCKDISSARGERFLELLQFKKKDSPIIYCVGWGLEWTKMGPISQGYLDTSFKKPFFIYPTPSRHFIHSMPSALIQQHALP